MTGHFSRKRAAFQMMYMLFEICNIFPGLKAAITKAGSWANGRVSNRPYCVLTTVSKAKRRKKLERPSTTAAFDVVVIHCGKMLKIVDNKISIIYCSC